MWSNNFIFNETYISYYGQVDDNDFHHHAATQIVFSFKQAIRIYSTVGDCQVGKGFVIPPLVNHKIDCLSDIAMIYVEPQSFAAFNALYEGETTSIKPLKSSLLSSININQRPSCWVKNLMLSRSYIPTALDHRLVAVFDFLKADPVNNSITDAANLVNLSETRLRSLVREQVGVPLATWLLWRKLNKSINALTQGETLISAAMTGGFSDQAHFNRTMRRMLGVTPKNASNILNQE